MLHEWQFVRDCADALNYQGHAYILLQGPGGGSLIWRIEKTDILDIFDMFDDNNTLIARGTLVYLFHWCDPKPGVVKIL